MRNSKTVDNKWSGLLAFFGPKKTVQPVSEITPLLDGLI